MTIQEMKARKEELGWSNETLARISGVPFATVQKVLGGSTKRPRQKTLEALTRALEQKKPSWPSSCRSSGSQPSMARETASAYGAGKREATIEDIYALPDDVWAELIDGQLYFIGTPTRLHQEIVGELHLAIANHIRSRRGTCKIYIPPFGVYLMADDSTYVIPDLSIICDRSKLDDRGCNGAPDWIIEVLSPSTQSKDMGKKAAKYSQAGVREYWLIHPEKKIILVYLYSQPSQTEFQAAIYSFEDEIESTVIPELKICLEDLLREA